MHHLKYWKLQRSPFPLDRPSVLATSSEFTSASKSSFFDQGTIQEAIARIYFLIQSQRRLGTLIGPSGVGMTSLLQQFCQTSTYAAKLPTDCRIHYVAIGGWTANRLYRWISSTIGHRTDSCDLYQSAIDSMAGRSAMPGSLVLVVDAGDCVSEDLWLALNELQNRSNRLTVLLAVSQNLAQSAFSNEDSSTGSTPSRQALAQMLRQSQLRIDLPAWGLGQTADYFSMMLESAGGRSGIFEAQAITRIHELANGLVKPMNQIADLSLVAAAARKSVRVPSELIDQICEELGLTSGPGEHSWTESNRFGSPLASN